MPEVDASLEQLGRAAANYIAGDSAVEQVQVALGADLSYRPVYRFSFLIDQERALMRPGLLRIRLSQRLQDELDALGDEHLFDIEILNREDWNKRTGGQSV